MLSTTLSTFGSRFVVAGRKIEHRLLSVKFDLSLFLFMFTIENVCSHKYICAAEFGQQPASQVFDTSVCVQAETSVES